MRVRSKYMYALQKMNGDVFVNIYESDNELPRTYM